MQDFKRICRKT